MQPPLGPSGIVPVDLAKRERVLETAGYDAPVRGLASGVI